MSTSTTFTTSAPGTASSHVKEHNNNNNTSASAGASTGLFGSPYKGSRGSEGRVGAGAGMGAGTGTGVGDSRAGGGKSGPTADCNEDKGVSRYYTPSFLPSPVTLTPSLSLSLLPSYTTSPPSLPSFLPLTLPLSSLSLLHLSYLSIDHAYLQYSNTPEHTQCNSISNSLISLVLPFHSPSPPHSYILSSHPPTLLHSYATYNNIFMMIFY